MEVLKCFARRHRVLWPVLATYRMLRDELVGLPGRIRHGAVHAREGQRLRRFRDRHRGKRCFVLGNGPSLRAQDLGLLRNELTFVTNHFVLHPELSSVRPTYYCVSDSAFFLNGGNPEWLRAMCVLPRETALFFPELFLPVVRGRAEFHGRKVYHLNYVGDRVCELGTMSVDVTKIVYRGDTVIVDFCLPLAFYMGFEEVYLLGCDMVFGSEGSEEDDGAHFYDGGQTTTRRKGQAGFKRSEWLRDVTMSFAIAKRLFEKRGRVIRNATAGGKLEVFPRARYEDVITQTDGPGRS